MGVARTIEGFWTCSKRYVLEQEVKKRGHRFPNADRVRVGEPMCAAECASRILSWLDSLGDPHGYLPADGARERAELAAGWAGTAGVLWDSLVATGWIVTRGGRLQWKDYYSFNGRLLQKRRRQQKHRAKEGGEERDSSHAEEGGNGHAVWPPLSRCPDVPMSQPAAAAAAAAPGVTPPRPAAAAAAVRGPVPPGPDPWPEERPTGATDGLAFALRAALRWRGTLAPCVQAVDDVLAAGVPEDEIRASLERDVKAIVGVMPLTWRDQFLDARRGALRTLAPLGDCMRCAQIGDTKPAVGEHSGERLCAAHLVTMGAPVP